MPPPDRAARDRLPVLVAGDIHGDLERLFQALRPYAPEAWHTVFLGDLIDGGMFGVGALRYARDRPNTTVLLGNHEVLNLWALEDRTVRPLWASVGGQPHDLQELAKDEELQIWLAQLPLLVKLGDGTLAQHSDTDLYGHLADHDAEDQIAAVNAQGRSLLEERDYAPLWDVMSPGDIFRTGRTRLDNWLRRTGARRVIHGHFPHTARAPLEYQDGLAINYDGGFSRSVGSPFRHRSGVRASVAPLP